MYMYILMLLQNLILGLQVSTETFHWTKISRDSFRTNFFLIFNQIMWLVPCWILTLLLAFILRFPALAFFYMTFDFFFVESSFWCFYIPYILYLVESFSCRCKDLRLFSNYTWLVHCTLTLLPLCVAGVLRDLAFAVFALHLILSLFNSRG